MNRHYTFLILFISLFILFGSCATKRLIKQASKMEEAGMYPEAADLYFQAVQRKNTNIDAISGLKRSGEFTLGRKLSDFNRAYNEQRNKEAVHYYLDAKAYYDKIKSVNIDLNFPSFYHDYYNEVKDIYLADKYFDAVNALNNDNFSQAETGFREIIKIQPNYKDAKDKLNIAVYEPIYRNSLDLMDNGKYREAYYKFNNIIAQMGTYKDSHDLRKECLDKGTFTIAISALKNSSPKKDITKTIETAIINNIQNLDNPFIKLIDNTKQLSARPNSTIQFAAPDATLFCEISSFKYDAGKLQEINKRGYIKKRVKYYNKETEKNEYRTEYDKVSYKEYKLNRNVELSISYRLINERSNEILSTGVRKINSSDNIHFAKYEGNSSNLVPGYWKKKTGSSEEDIVKDNRRDVQNLQSLLQARDKIKDYNTLLNEAVNASSDYVGTEINNYVKSN